MSAVNFDSHMLNALTDGLLNTFLASGYIITIAYGFFQAFNDALSFGISYTLILFGILSLLINYYKIPRAPEAHVKAVLGEDPTLKGKATKEENANTEIFSCGVGLLRNIENRDEMRSLLKGTDSSSYLTVVAHRGAGLDAPENSLSAFRQCKLRGCDFIELDVALSKDNVPVIFHDDDLIRMTGVNRKVCDLTYAELSKLDISVNHPLRDKFKGEKIPTLEETIKLLIQYKMKVFIDLKDTDEPIVNAICDAFTRHPELYSLAVVSSFFAKVIYNIRRRDPKIIGCMAWRPQAWQYKGWNVDGSLMEPRFSFFLQDYYAAFWDVYHDWVFNHLYWWFMGLSAVLIQKDSVSRYDISRWSKKGVQVFLWTVNQPVEKLYWAKIANIRYLTDTLDGDVLQSAPIDTK